MFQLSDISQLERMHAAADRTRQMIHARAIKAYCRAMGGTYTRDSQLCNCVIHNSIIAFENGQPWKEVDYSQMRRARWLVQKSFEPSRIVTAWYQRKSRESTS
jgi:hypothetical protein